MIDLPNPIGVRPLDWQLLENCRDISWILFLLTLLLGVTGRTLHPDTLVLTTDTGHIRSYATDPYGSYYTEPQIMFPVEHRDDRMNPKESDSRIPSG